MFMMSALSLALLVSGSACQADDAQFGATPLVEGRNLEAIAQINEQDAVAQEDPARLINLGIAHAREGREARARELFKAALTSVDPVELEIADGEWVDSQRLARIALRMLEAGEFRVSMPAERVTLRE